MRLLMNCNGGKIALSSMNQKSALKDVNAYFAELKRKNEMTTNQSMSETAREAFEIALISANGPFYDGELDKCDYAPHRYNNDETDLQWQGFKLALSKLPTMTEGEFVRLARPHLPIETNNDHEIACIKDVWHALVFRCPHLITPEPLVKVGESK